MAQDGSRCWSSPTPSGAGADLRSIRRPCRSRGDEESGRRRYRRIAVATHRNVAALPHRVRCRASPRSRPAAATGVAECARVTAQAEPRSTRRAAPGIARARSRDTPRRCPTPRAARRTVRSSAAARHAVGCRQLYSVSSARSGAACIRCPSVFSALKRKCGFELRA